MAASVWLDAPLTRADVDAFVDRLEQPGEGVGGRLRARPSWLRLQCGCGVGVLVGYSALVLLIDRAPDVGRRLDARRVHLPRGHARRRCRSRSRCRAGSTRGLPSAFAARDEAVLVVAVPVALAAAEAGHVLEDLGMPRGELVGRARERRRPRRGELHDRQRRQLRRRTLTPARGRGAVGAPAARGRRRGDAPPARGDDQQRRATRTSTSAARRALSRAHGAIVTPSTRTRLDRIASSAATTSRRPRHAV